MRKKRLAKATAIFFALMLCFTILSRAAYQEGTAVVKVGRPENRMIAHRITAEGKTQQNQELAVVTEPDQRVTGIYVKEGQRVAKGDLLFQIDTDLLDEKILYQKQELEKHKLQTGDVQSRADASGARKANDIAQAQENYSLNVNRANTQLSRAKRDLDSAKTELENFRKTKGTSSGDSTVSQQLEKQCEEMNEAYIQAQQDLVTLQWKIEQAVNQALQQATSGATLMEENSVHTRSEDMEDGLVLEDSEFQESADEETEGWEDLILDLDQSGASDNDPSSYIIDGSNTNQDSSIISSPNTSQDSYQSGSQYTEKTVTQAQLDEIEKKVRAQYQSQLDAARKKVETAKSEKETADAALAQYQQEQASAATSQNAQTEQQLLANVRTAQDAYVDAAINANEAAVTGGRAIQTAGLPDGSDSTLQVNEITYEQMELALKKLEKLKAKKGKIYAPVDGMVTKINITTGEKTLDTTAMLLADLSKGYRFTADITKDQQKYIGTGDLVTLTAGNKTKLEDLPVSSVTVDDQDNSIYHLTVQLPEDCPEIGTALTMEYTKKSQAYPVCVPLSALHVDDNNQAYVLVPDEYETIMGTEVRARKVGVLVLEKNESYAALEEGTLSAQQDIIVQADKTVQEGSRVRISEK